MNSEAIRNRLELELKEGEKLFWTGKPTQIIIKPFGLYVGSCALLSLSGFTVFTCYLLFASIINPSALLACAAIFLAFTTVMLFHAFKFHLKHLFGPSFELYGVTNERVIILSPLFKSEQKSIPIKTVKPVTVEGEKIGTITFENEIIPKIAVPLTNAWWAIMDLWMRSDLAYFHKIKNPRRVFELIKQLHTET